MPRDPSHTPPLLRKAHRLHAEVWKMRICCICHIHTVYTRRWSQGIEPLHGVDLFFYVWYIKKPLEQWHIRREKGCFWARVRSAKSGCRSGAYERSIKMKTFLFVAG